MAAQLVNTASFHRTADPQLSSRFFTLLPAEIRNLIYIEYCHLTSPHQHVDMVPVEQEGCESPAAEPAMVWNHVPCITDPCADDIRFGKFYAAENGSPEKAAWEKRLRSEWCLHWACEEYQKVKPKTGFLNILTACKRMYMEFLPALYSTTTFVMTDMATAENFLSRYGNDPERYPLRSLELCIRTTNILPELYYPPRVSGLGDEGPPAIFAGRARPGLDMKNNPWQRVCDMLVEQSQLQDLRVWFHSRDLRPWHKRVSEIRFFGRLMQVRVADKKRFVLSLPELPARRGGPDSEILAGHFLEGENLENVPFTVERRERPNNWDVHLARQGLPRSRSISAISSTAYSGL